MFIQIKARGCSDAEGQADAQGEPLKSCSCSARCAAGSQGLK